MQYSTTAPKDFRKGSVFLISSALFLKSSLIATDVRETFFVAFHTDAIRFVFESDEQKYHKGILHPIT